MSKDESDILFIVLCFVVYLWFGSTGLSILVVLCLGVGGLLLPTLTAGALMTGALKGGYFHFTPAFGVFLLILSYLIYKWFKK
ncbi:MAG: hypothetical protein IJX10_05760 [Phascolarctobacterium sp.]|nr:hypothetical protein [Phascolarctobacterium sp.]